MRCHLAHKLLELFSSENFTDHELLPMKHAIKQTLLFCVIFTVTGFSFAQTTKPNATITQLLRLDKQVLEKRVDTIDKLARLKLGNQFHGDLSDIELLQRIIDEKLIAKDDSLMMQSAGVVLGNVMVEELGLRWIIYEDRLGRSRALCVNNTSNCLFPVTMLSRRLEVNAPVDVQKIYDDAVAIIDPYIPDYNAYDGKKEEPKKDPGWSPVRKKPNNKIRIRTYP